jgi:hypothetical protein
MVSWARSKDLALEDDEDAAFVAKMYKRAGASRKDGPVVVNRALSGQELEAYEARKRAMLEQLSTSLDQYEAGLREGTISPSTSAASSVAQVHTSKASHPSQIKSSGTSQHVPTGVQAPARGQVPQQSTFIDPKLLPPLVHRSLLELQTTNNLVRAASPHSVIGAGPQTGSINTVTQQQQVQTAQQAQQLLSAGFQNPISIGPGLSIQRMPLPNQAASQQVSNPQSASVSDRSNQPSLQLDISQAQQRSQTYLDLSRELSNVRQETVLAANSGEESEVPSDQIPQPSFNDPANAREAQLAALLKTLPVAVDPTAAGNNLSLAIAQTPQGPKLVTVLTTPTPTTTQSKPPSDTPTSVTPGSIRGHSDTDRVPVPRGITFYSHVPTEIQKDIRDGKFVDLTKLIRTSTQFTRTRKDTFQPNAQGFMVTVKQEPRKIGDFFVWLYTFRAFAAIYIQSHPSVSPLCLYQYEYMIQRHSRAYRWNAVLNFDTRARTDIAENMAPWEDQRLDLVAEELYPYPAKADDFKGPGGQPRGTTPFASNGFGSPRPRAPTGSSLPPMPFSTNGACRNWNADRCSGFPCTRPHICSICGGAHKFYECAARSRPATPFTPRGGFTSGPRFDSRPPRPPPASNNATTI